MCVGKVDLSGLAAWRLPAGEPNFTGGALQGSLVGPPRIKPLDMCSCRNVLGTWPDALRNCRLRGGSMSH